MFTSSNEYHPTLEPLEDRWVPDAVGLTGSVDSPQPAIAATAAPLTAAPTGTPVQAQPGQALAGRAVPAAGLTAGQALPQTNVPTAGQVALPTATVPVLGTPGVATPPLPNLVPLPAGSLPTLGTADPRLLATQPGQATAPPAPATLNAVQQVATQSALGFPGRLVFPGTGLQVRSPTGQGPVDQPPGQFLSGGDPGEQGSTLTPRREGTAVALNGERSDVPETLVAVAEPAEGAADGSDSGVEPQER